MESLLRWGIENTPLNADGSPAPPQNRQPLDTGVIDAILGKPDSELMKEAMAVAVDEKQSMDERLTALDNLEMLIESIDNANNLESLRMWKPLHDLLNSADPIKTQALWVIGTALQNNPSAQVSYMSLGPLPSLLGCLEAGSTSAKTRSKAVYALSGLLKHNAAAVKALNDANAYGWTVLSSALEDSDITVRRKIAFLLNTLLMPTSPAPTTPASLQTPPVHANSHASMLSDPDSTSTSAATFKALRDNGVLAAVIDSLVAPIPFGADGDSHGDLDFEEKIIRLLHTYTTSCQGVLSASEKQKLRACFEKRSGEDAFEKWGLDGNEAKELQDIVA